MNGLYGYPTSGAMSLGALGANAESDYDEASKATLWSMLNGDMYQQILGMKAQIDQQTKILDSQLAQLNALPEGAQKSQAKQTYALANASLTQQFVTYRELRDKYNSTITQLSPWISTLSLGIATPPKLAGLGNLGVVPLVIAGYSLAQIAIMAGVTVVVLYAISDLIRSFQPQAQQTQKYSNSLAQILAAGGEVVSSVTGGVKDIAIAAAIALGVFLVFKFIQKRGSSGSASPVTIDLKPASVSEIKALPMGS